MQSFARRAWRLVRKVAIAKATRAASETFDEMWRGPDGRWLEGAPLKKIVQGRLATVHAEREATSAFRALLFPKEPA